MLPAQIKKKKMIATASKTLILEKAFRQTGCFGLIAYSNHSNFLSG
jgi:hypothetical protein